MEPTRFLEGITHYFTTLICIFMFQCCQFEILRLYNTYTPVGEKGSCLARGRGECLGLRLYMWQLYLWVRRGPVWLGRGMSVWEDTSGPTAIPVGEKGSCLARGRG